MNVNGEKLSGKDRFWSASCRLVFWGAILLLGGAGARFVWRATAPEPPVVDTTNFDPAVAELIDRTRKAVRASPRSAEKWGRLGMVLLAHDLPTPAARCLAFAEKSSPRDARWPYLLGHALRIDNPRRAAEAFERAVAKKPDDSYAHLRLGEMLLELDRPDEAQRHFQATLAREPENPVAALGVAKVCVSSQHWEKARAALAQAQDQPDTAKSALRMLVIVQQRLGDMLGAEATARRLDSMPEDQIPFDPLLEEARSLKTGEKAWLDRVDHLNAATQFTEAWAAMEKLAREYPNSARVWLYLGTARSRAGKTDIAEAAYRRSIALSADSVEANNQLGVLLAGLQRHAEAIECYQKVIAIKPNLGEGWYNLGLSLGELGKIKDADSAFRNALRCKPNLNEARIALALVLERQGQMAEAAAALREALAQNPSDDRATKALRRVEK